MITPAVNPHRLNREVSTRMRNAHEFHGVAQLKAGLRIAGNRYKSHIKHGFTVEPPGFYSVFSKDDTGNNTERGGQHVGSIDCCQAKSVDGKFQDRKLPDRGTFRGSDRRIKASQSGISWGFCMNKSQAGVSSRDKREMVIRDSLR